MIDVSLPTCQVRGRIAPGTACGSAIVGMQLCGAAPGSCEHQGEPMRQPGTTGLQEPNKPYAKIPPITTQG